MSTSLHRILYVDFLGALLTVVVMLAAADLLGPHVGLPAPVLRMIAVAFVPFVVFVLLSARSSTVRRGRVYAIVTVNLLWMLASILLLAFGGPTTWGAWIISAQALLVVPLVFVEIRAL